MRHLLLFLPLLVLSLLPARAVQVKLDSPDTNSTWVSAQISDRDLRWNEKTRSLQAVVTFEDALHSNTTSATDTLYFHCPETYYNADDHTVYVNGPDGAPIVIGQWFKGTFGHRFLLYENTLVIVHRNKSQITLSLDIDTQRTIEKERKKEEGEQTESFTLDGLIHKKE